MSRNLNQIRGYLRFTVLLLITGCSLFIDSEQTDDSMGTATSPGFGVDSGDVGITTDGTDSGNETTGGSDGGDSDGGGTDFTCPNDQWTEASFNGDIHCYRLFPENILWQNAEDNCIAEGEAISAKGHLVSIHSATENLLVQNLYTQNDNVDQVTKDLWIGLNKLGDPSGSFTTFSDGSIFNESQYANWESDTMEPNRPDSEFCVDLRIDGQWHDQGCQIERGNAYVCELVGSDEL